MNLSTLWEMVKSACTCAPVDIQLSLPVEENPKLPQRKKRDSTKLTQYHFDFICYARKEWERYNQDFPDQKKPLSELVETINARMGTDKSLRALYDVWSGRVNRDDLPVGKPTFEY
jgi:hypothetical protein